MSAQQPQAQAVCVGMTAVPHSLQGDDSRDVRLLGCSEQCASAIPRGSSQGGNGLSDVGACWQGDVQPNILCAGLQQPSGCCGSCGGSCGDV